MMDDKDLTEVVRLHDENREREVQLLVDEVLSIGVEFYDDPNGPYCPYCYKEKTGGYKALATSIGMDDIDHGPSCAYLIAKGLKIKEGNNGR
jgi:hypothetical protein